MANNYCSLCVVGASNVDIHVRMQEELQNDTSIVGEIYLTAGGVGRNIVDSLAGLKTHVSFISVFSDDIFSSILLEGLKNKYISLENSLFHVQETSKYVNIMTAGTVYSVNDIKSVNDLSVPFIKKKLSLLCDTSYVIFDLNIRDDVVNFITQNVNSKLVCEATSSVKCTKILKSLNKLYILKANYKEACIIAECDQNINYNELLDILLSKGVEKVYITLGNKGALYADRKIKLYVDNQKIVDASDTVGAGDVFMAGILYGEVRHWSHKHILNFCNRLCYGYLLSGKHKLTHDLECYSLDPLNNTANLFAWNVFTSQWIKEDKYNGKEENNQDYSNNNINNY